MVTDLIKTTLYILKNFKILELVTKLLFHFNSTRRRVAVVVGVTKHTITETNVT